jgi:hypothetical protein
MLAGIDQDEIPELYAQYLGALTIIEDPRASVASIKDVVKMVGELVGLYRQHVDITARRAKLEMSEEELADAFQALPDSVKAAITGKVIDAPG